jgi:hypothetical protein
MIAPNCENESINLLHDITEANFNSMLVCVLPESFPNVVTHAVQPEEHG